MQFELSNCIAFGVSDMDKAADFYQEVLGYERIQQKPGWIELRSGALRIFVCNDDVTQPVFDLQVSDVPAAVEHLALRGFERVVFDEDDTETFMKDPFGYTYCISPQKT